MEYERIVERVVRGEAIGEGVLRGLCGKLIERLAEESNLVEVEGPISIVGDVHGQFYDVLKLLAIGWMWFM